MAWAVSLVVFLGAAASTLHQCRARPPEMSWPFRGITGPSSSTLIAPRASTQWTHFARGSRSRLAILLTDTTSTWLGMAHALETIGIPFVITRDAGEAVRHSVVLVYPNVSGATLTHEALHSLVTFVHSGGTLIANEVLVGGMNEVFGFQKALPSRSRFELRFQSAGLTADFTDPLERTIRLDDRAQQALSRWTVGYTDASDPVAIFDDGTAAITRRVFEGGGEAIALGVDIGALCFLSHDVRDEFIAREFANGYEPVLDVFLRLLKTIYAGAAGGMVTLGTVPEGRSLAVLLTHDIDYRYSLGNALAFAEYERAQGIRATYFVQTKYIKDWEDEAFFDSAAVTNVRALDSLGMEIASHTVAHARTFNTMPTGTGEERYPDYQPRVLGPTRTRGATVLGELRVSAFLLQQATGKPVESFRAGYLRNPWVLPQALAATGYRCSSSFTADNALSHLPLHLNYNREPGAELPLFDFPVTVEDEEAPPLMDRLDAALALARRLAVYGGTYVVLLHTNTVSPKLEFEKSLVDSLRPKAWFGSVAEFGAFWAARSSASVDVEGNGERKIVTLILPCAVRGLTVEAPVSWRFLGAEPSEVQAAPSATGVVVTAGPGTVRLAFISN